MPHQIVLALDCVSPWSYIAFHVLKRYADKWPIHIEWHPASLAYVMKYANNQPPVTVPNKGKHMLRQLQMAERMYGVTLHMPDVFPFQTFPVVGLLRAIQEKYPSRLECMIETCLHKIWHEGHHVLLREDLKVLLQKYFRDDEAADLLDRAFSKSMRQLLAHEAQALVDQGAFGFPWIMAKRDFGVEQLEYLAAFLHEPYLGPMATGVTPRL